MSVRISASDWADGGVSEEDTFAIARAFAAAGCDLIDVSSGQTVPHQSPVYGRMYQVPLAEAIKNELGLKTMCVGAITEPGQVNTIVQCRRADLVAVGRPHLTDPNWSLRAAAWYGKRAVRPPAPYLSGAAQLMRESEKARDKARELADQGQAQASPQRAQAAAGGGVNNRVLQPPGWPRPPGYANGIAAIGRTVYTAGLVGWDAAGPVPRRTDRAMCADVRQHRRGAGRGRRGAGRSGADDVVYPQPGRVSGRSARDRCGVPGCVSGKAIPRWRWCRWPG